MSGFAVFDVADGRIVTSGSMPDFMVPLQAGAGQKWVITPDGVHYRTHYISDVDLGLWALKAALPAPDKTAVTADGADAATIVGLPNPTFYKIAGDGDDAGTVTDGTLVLTFTAPGRYRLLLDAGVAYLPVEVEIVAS